MYDDPPEIFEAKGLPPHFPPLFSPNKSAIQFIYTARNRQKRLEAMFENPDMLDRQNTKQARREIAFNKDKEVNIIIAL